jgi:hypothetical protein
VVRHSFLAAAIVVTTWGCRAPTEIVVELTTTADCSAVSGAGTAMTVARPDALAGSAPSTTVHTCAAGTIGSLVLVPSASTSDAVGVQVVVATSGSVESCDPARPGPTCIVARRLLKYVPHESLHLPIVMRASCAGVACPSDQTCVNGACTGAAITCTAGQTCDEGALSGGGGAGASDGGAPIADASLEGGAPVDAVAPEEAGPDAGGGPFRVAMVYADAPGVLTTLVGLFQAAGNAPIWSDQGLASAGNVSAATLEANSDALLVWSSAPFKDATTLGDTVATYLESGRQVVLAGNVYEALTLGGIGGRMRASYMLFDPGVTRLTAVGGYTLTPLLASPVLLGLGPIQAKTPPGVSASPIAGALVVAEWFDGAAVHLPVVVTGTVTVLGTPRKRVDLNMQPAPFSTSFASGWTGSGLDLLLNALRYK